ncbi:MAG: prepilin-type N-terminal cleavage/methylation domain-containing protein [Chloroflexi bacterium]|nr:prepilin-type N-terminal cleavage/methylation domain-containing protein [Chloroflexota bacterium]
MKRYCCSVTKQGFTLIEIMIVVGILGLIVALAIPNFLKSRTQARKQICLENLSQIESAKQIWGVENGKQEGEIPAEADLVGPELYIKKTPECPAGGTYDFGSIGVDATCSFPGHTL